jgi:hypothetical protein
MKASEVSRSWQRAPRTLPANKSTRRSCVPGLIEHHKMWEDLRWEEDEFIRHIREQLPTARMLPS